MLGEHLLAQRGRASYTPRGCYRSSDDSTGKNNSNYATAQISDSGWQMDKARTWERFHGAFIVTEDGDLLIKASFKHTAWTNCWSYSKENSLLFSHDILSICALVKLHVGADIPKWWTYFRWIIPDLLAKILPPFTHSWSLLSEWIIWCGFRFEEVNFLRRLMDLSPVLTMTCIQ